MSYQIGDHDQVPEGAELIFSLELRIPVEGKWISNVSLYHTGPGEVQIFYTIDEGGAANE